MANATVCDRGGGGYGGRSALPSSLVVDENGQAPEPAEPVPADSTSDKPEPEPEPAGLTSDAGPDPDAEQSPTGATMTKVQLRRAPRYRAFVFTGALIGMVVATVLATVLPLAEGSSLKTVFLYFALPLGLIGGLAGAGAAILVERRR